MGDSNHHYNTRNHNNCNTPDQAESELPNTHENKQSEGNIHPDNVAKLNMCSPSCTPRRESCPMCKIVGDGLDNPVGNLLHREIFTEGIRMLQEGNFCALRNGRIHDHHQDTNTSKSSPNNKHCQHCRNIDDGLRNSRYADGQFGLPVLSRTSRQATSESPDYIAFQNGGSCASRRRVYHCRKCTNMDVHLRDGLFRDMRNFYETLQWQKNSHDIDNSYAYKDGIPYAPFANEPNGKSVERTQTSCDHCHQMQSDSKRVRRRSRDIWNPYSLRDSASRWGCTFCAPRGIDCNGCPNWSFH